MERFKKKTIALILASVVTVTGSFAAENYKNTIKSLKIEDTAQGTNLIIQTQNQFNGTINPIKKDSNTYVIMLPDIKSDMVSYPELTGNITGVDVKTMPYTTSGNGYTKITVKTFPNVVLTAKNTLYVPKQQDTNMLSDNNSPSPKTVDRTIVQNTTNSNNTNRDSQRTSYSDLPNQQEQYNNDVSVEPKTDTYNNSNNSTEPQSNYDETSSDNSLNKTENKVNTQSSEDILYLLGGILLIITVTVFLYIKSKRRLREMLGDQSDMDFSDESKTKNNKRKHISSKDLKKTIAALDKMYSKPIKMPINGTNELTEKNTKQILEDDNIVDLDELFNSQNKNNSSQNTEEAEENDALEAFLSGFSFEEDIPQQPSQEQFINQELYDKYITDGNLKFSDDDIEKINILMQNEVSENAIKNIEKEQQKPKSNNLSKQEVLENMLTTLAIKQNVSFSKDDVDAIKKIMSVELDNDFITDLRTNPERAQKMRKEIEERNVSASKKVNEILTLNVKDMLPDLSEALKKQGKRAIESEAKPEVVYYSEGYEYTTLSIKNELPDLHSAKNIKENTYRPSDDVEYAIQGYDAPTLKIEGFLPDLEDVKAHPKKYEEKKSTPVKVNEKDMLKNISNVSFKPFYDGNEDFEIINKPEDFIQTENNDFDSFSNFEIVNEDIIEDLSDNTENKLAELDEDMYYDLDNNKIEAPEGIITETDKELLEALSTQQTDGVQQKSKEKNESQINKSKPVSSTQIPDVCIIENETYKIIKSQEFTDNLGCYLAKKDNGYAILGYVGNKIFEIKYYEKLNSENFQTRVTEKLPDGTLRYIIRIGLHKFILNVSEEDMEYVMDLC